MFAHSLRFVLPRITTPAARRRSTTKASRGAGAPTSASDPAVVSILSPVSMLSLISTGNAVERAAWALRLPLGVERVGDRERVRIGFDDRPQSWAGGVDLRDPLKIELHEPARGIAAGRHSLLELRNRHLVQLELRRRLARSRAGSPTESMCRRCRGSRRRRQRSGMGGQARRTDYCKVKGRRSKPVRSRRILITKNS